MEIGKKQKIIYENTGLSRRGRRETATLHSDAGACRRNRVTRPPTEKERTLRPSPVLNLFYKKKRLRDKYQNKNAGQRIHRQIGKGNLGIKELTGDVEQYQDFFAALERTSPFDISFEALGGSVKGRCNYEEKRISINEGMDELQNIKTAIHEIAHATLHDIDKDAPERPDRRTREVQAESVAYAVCQHYGLDTSDYSFGYIAGWSSGKELAELKGSLETIRSTAASLIDTIDGHFAEIQQAQDKEQTTEQAQPAQEATIQPEAEAAAPELPEETAPVQEKEAQTEPEADTGASSEAPQTTQPGQAAPAAPYYTINEAAAKRAKDANSFSDYKQGSATAEYRHYVDEAVQLAERQKQPGRPDVP